MRANALLGRFGSIAVAAICAFGAACIIVVDDDDDRTYCEYDGERHEVGESFPAGDGCNTCGCELDEDGPRTWCTAIACLPDAVTWTNRLSATTAIDVDGVVVNMGGGHPWPGPGTPVVTRFDRLGTMP